MAYAKEISIVADTGGLSHSVAASTTSAQSNAINHTHCLVTPSATVFMRAGLNPTALADGTDIVLTGGATYRVEMPRNGSAWKLAFICATGTATVYITPGA